MAPHQSAADYERGPEKTWFYGVLRECDGEVMSRCAASRNSKGYVALLADIEAENSKVDLYIIIDNLSSHLLVVLNNTVLGLFARQGETMWLRLVANLLIL